MNSKIFFVITALGCILLSPFAGAAATGQTSKTLSVAAGNWVISSSLDIPVTAKLKVQPGGTIFLASGVTLTIHGTMEAPVARVFTGSGEVVFDTDFAQTVYPQWWGAKGDGMADDTIPFQTAINSFSGKGGGIFVPAGTYLVGMIGMKSNITLSGSGTGSILKQKTGSDYCINTNPSNTGINTARNYTQNPSNIRLSGLTFRGTVDTDGFSEHIHLLQIEAATQVSVDSCSFIGFRGDGIYLGEGPNKSHNAKVSITNCIINGVNGDNRNGISIIDGDGILIQQCTISNCTRASMPGGIDVEPDYSYNIVKNIKIDNNRFSSIGGFSMVQVWVAPGLVLDTAMQNIEITNNTLTGSGLGTGICVAQSAAMNSNTVATNVLIANNTVKQTNRSFMITGVRNVILQGNSFDGSLAAPCIGAADGSSGLMDVKLVGNTFRNLSQNDGIGVDVSWIENLEISNNIFDNIGKSDRSGGNALYFSSTGPFAKHITIENNTFSGVNTSVAIQRQAGNITFPDLNIMSGNVFGDKMVYLPTR